MLLASQPKNMKNGGLKQQRCGSWGCSQNFWDSPNPRWFSIFNPDKFGGLVAVTMFVDLSDLSAGQQNFGFGMAVQKSQSRTTHQ